MAAFELQHCIGRLCPRGRVDVILILSHFGFWMLSCTHTRLGCWISLDVCRYWNACRICSFKSHMSQGYTDGLYNLEWFYNDIEHYSLRGLLHPIFWRERGVGCLDDRKKRKSDVCIVWIYCLQCCCVMSHLAGPDFVRCFWKWELYAISMFPNAQDKWTMVHKENHASINMQLILSPNSKFN